MSLHLGPAGDLRARLAKEKKKRKGAAFPGAAEPFNGRKPPKKRKSGSSHPSPKRRTK